MITPGSWSARRCSLLPAVADGFTAAMKQYGVPAEVLTDYAEVDVKPENLSPACSGRVC